MEGAVLPRVRLWEFHDQPWVPATVREFIVDVLCFGWTLPPCPPLAPAVVAADALDAVVRDAGTATVVDLCSGAGGPMPTVAWTLARRAQRRQQCPPRVVLTDLYPEVRAWRALATAHVGFIDYPVDAARVPRELRGVRVMTGAFHHFPPAAAEAVLRDAVANRCPIVVVEPTERSLPHLVIMTAVAVGLCYALPLASLLSTLLTALFAADAPPAAAPSTLSSVALGFVARLRAAMAGAPEPLSPAGRSPTTRGGAFPQRHRAVPRPVFTPDGSEGSDDGQQPVGSRPPSPFRWLTGSTQHPTLLQWALVFVVPVLPLVMLWDSVVSQLRSYTRPELEDLTAAADPTGIFAWSVERRKMHWWLPFVYVTLLTGVPAADRD